MSNSESTEGERRVGLTKLLVEVAVLAERVDRLIDSNKIQDSQLDKLIELANKGKGSWWMLTVIGAVLGFILANIRHVIQLIGG